MRSRIRRSILALAMMGVSLATLAGDQVLLGTHAVTVFRIARGLTVVTD